MTDAAPPRLPALALVQHAHQLIITTRYDERESIDELVDAYAAVLSLHREYRVPLGLHMSGMLLEAVAWHRPALLDRIRGLARDGLLELIGSAYAQNILPACGDEHNRRQLCEGLACYRRLLDVDPADIRTLWLPERVWRTDRLAPLLRDPTLPNGGYDAVLLDDRLAYPLEAGRGRVSRNEFDRHTIPARRAWGAEGEATGPAVGRRRPVDHLRPFRIDGADGLVAFPISGDLRYAIPPRDAGAWRAVARVLDEVAAAGPGALAVFGDDLERSAGVGPWTAAPWTRDAVVPYERFLARLRSERIAEPVRLTEWLRRHPPVECRVVDPGTYFELARVRAAGETYSRWRDAPAWRPYARLLASAEAVAARVDWPGARIHELAWKHLMACSVETAWHEPDPQGRPRPAPWARAAAAHARAVFVLRAAADWLPHRHGTARAELVDVDGDGYDEVVLANDRLFAVVTPEFGGRLVYLFELAGGDARLIVGNPADDWNWQEESNRFMTAPRNHPGAFVDVGHENDRWMPARLRSRPWLAEVRLVNRVPGSPLEGAVKRFRLRARARSIDAGYHLRATSRWRGRRIEFGLSPDYLSLLTTGRAALRRIRAGRRRGCRAGDCVAWIDPGPDPGLRWEAAVQPVFGHGLTYRLAADVQRFRIRVGAGHGIRERAGDSPPRT